MPRARETPYGLRSMPSLVERIEQSAPHETKKRALLLLKQKVRSTEDLATALKAGLVGSLVKFFDDARLKLHAVGCLAEVAHSTLGARSIMESGGDGAIAHMLELFKDRHEYDSKLRLRLLDTFVRLSNNSIHAPLAMVRAGYVTEMIKEVKAASEHADFRWRALETLHQCCRVEEGSMSALEEGCVELCVSQLREYDDVETMKASALALTANTFHFEGKRRGLECGIVVAAAAILARREASVDAIPPLCSALTNVLILNEAKRELVNARAIDCILQLVVEGVYEVQLSALKLLTMIVAHPDARKAANRPELIETLQTMANNTQRRLMSKLASRALREVLWTP